MGFERYGGMAWKKYQVLFPVAELFKERLMKLCWPSKAAAFFHRCIPPNIKDARDKPPALGGSLFSH